MSDKIDREMEDLDQWLIELNVRLKNGDVVDALLARVLIFALCFNKGVLSIISGVSRLFTPKSRSSSGKVSSLPRPPFNAEYLLYLFLRKEERDGVIGD